MNIYKEPEAHHWIMLRLIRVYAKTTNSYTRDHAKSIVWLIHELGGNRVMQMLTELQQEDSRS